MNPEFLPLAGYESRYAISPDGIIITIPKSTIDALGRIKNKPSITMTQRVDKRSGYLVTKLSKPDGSHGTQYVHRLVALTFLKNPENHPIVNHKDGNKLNPNAENLEWTSYSNNQKHAISMRLAKPPVQKTTPVINICTGKRYNSIKEAAQMHGIPYDKCMRQIAGKTKNHTCLRRAA